MRGDHPIAEPHWLTRQTLNGLDLDAEEADVVDTMQNVASGQMSEPSLARWIGKRCRPVD